MAAHMLTPPVWVCAATVSQSWLTFAQASMSQPVNRLSSGSSTVARMTSRSMVCIRARSSSTAGPPHNWRLRSDCQPPQLDFFRPGETAIRSRTTWRSCALSSSQSGQKWVNSGLAPMSSPARVNPGTAVLSEVTSSTVIASPSPRSQVLFRLTQQVARPRNLCCYGAHAELWIPPLPRLVDSAAPLTVLLVNQGKVYEPPAIGRQDLHLSADSPIEK